jgi:glycerate kinase
MACPGVLIPFIPDSFKGTMSSEEICTIMDKAIKNHYPNAQVKQIPVANGGRRKC